MGWYIGKKEEIVQEGETKVLCLLLGRKNLFEPWNGSIE